MKINKTHFFIYFDSDHTIKNIEKKFLYRVSSKSSDGGGVDQLDEQGSGNSALDQLGGSISGHGEVGRCESGRLRLSSSTGVGNTLVIQRSKRLGVDLELESNSGASRDPDEIAGNEAVLNTVVILVVGVNGSSSRVLGQIGNGGSVSESVGVNGISQQLGDVADGDASGQIADVTSSSILRLAGQQSLERSAIKVVVSVDGKLRSSSEER